MIKVNAAEWFRALTGREEPLSEAGGLNAASSILIYKYIVQ